MQNRHQKLKQVPKLSQIQQIFESNGFRLNNIITKVQLQQFFNQQYIKNKSSEQIHYDKDKQESLQQQDIQFDKQIFNQLWGHLQTTSTNSVKIQNICNILHKAITKLKQKIQILKSKNGIIQRKNKIQQLKKQQNQLFKQLDAIDPEYNYHQQKTKSQLQIVRKCISKITAQKQQMQTDLNNFIRQYNILVLLIGSSIFNKQQSNLFNKSIIQSKYINQLNQSMFLSKTFGQQQKKYSASLNMIFILTLCIFVLQLVILNYRLSFMTILGSIGLLYWLFFGYYHQNFIIYLLIYFISTILLDATYVVLDMFTLTILSARYSGTQFIKIIYVCLLVISILSRIILALKMLQFKKVPTKIIYYFIFMGKQIILNRRTKNMMLSLNIHVQKTFKSIQKHQMENHQYYQS